MMATKVRAQGSKEEVKRQSRWCWSAASITSKYRSVAGGRAAAGRGVAEMKSGGGGARKGKESLGDCRHFSSFVKDRIWAGHRFLGFHQSVTIDCSKSAFVLPCLAWPV